MLEVDGFVAAPSRLEYTWSSPILKELFVIRRVLRYAPALRVRLELHAESTTGAFKSLLTLPQDPPRAFVLEPNSTADDIDRFRDAIVDTYHDQCRRHFSALRDPDRGVDELISRAQLISATFFASEFGDYRRLDDVGAAAVMALPSYVSIEPKVNLLSTIGRELRRYGLPLSAPFRFAVESLLAERDAPELEALLRS